MICLRRLSVVDDLTHSGRPRARLIAGASDNIRAALVGDSVDEPSAPGDLVAQRRNTGIHRSATQQVVGKQATQVCTRRAARCSWLCFSAPLGSMQASRPRHAKLAMPFPTTLRRAYGKTSPVSRANANTQSKASSRRPTRAEPERAGCTYSLVHCHRRLRPPGIHAVGGICACERLRSHLPKARCRCSSAGRPGYERRPGRAACVSPLGS